METIEYRTKDKSAWGDGPWKDEPDKKQWQDEATGLACLIVRPWGSLCGYVGVPPGHPAFGKDYSDIDVDVHGGLTFAGECQQGPENEVVCHKPAEGEPDSVWWLGFDCAHYGDLDPHPRRTAFGRFRDGDEVYRDMAYVTNEVHKLASQLASMKSA